jgi:hypothetical protein
MSIINILPTFPIARSEYRRECKPGHGSGRREGLLQHSAEFRQPVATAGSPITSCPHYKKLG